MQQVCVRSIGQLGLPPPLIPFRHGFQNLFDILKNLSPEFLKFLIETNTDILLNPIKRGSKLLKFGVMITEFSTELSQPDMGLSHPLIQGLSSDRSCIEYKFRQCLRKLGRVTDCSGRDHGSLPFYLGLALISIVPWPISLALHLLEGQQMLREREVQSFRFSQLPVQSNFRRSRGRRRNFPVKTVPTTPAPKPPANVWNAWPPAMSQIGSSSASASVAQLNAAAWPVSTGVSLRWRGF